MQLKIQSIRFSKDFFNNYESCAKWLENNGYTGLPYEEFDTVFSFKVADKEKLDEATMQAFKLDSGVEAQVGLAINVDPTVDNITDSESIKITTDASPTPTAQPSAAKSVVAAFSSFLGEMQSAITNLAPTIDQLNKHINQTEIAKSNLDEKDNATINIMVPIIKAKDERIIFGEVLIPNEVDGQGHTYSAIEVAKAAHWWMKNYAQLGEMHEESLTEQDIQVLETYIAPVSFDIEKSDGAVKVVKKGTWLLKAYVVSDELWTKVKDGDLNGFSIGGVATVHELT